MQAYIALPKVCSHLKVIPFPPQFLMILSHSFFKHCLFPRVPFWEHKGLQYERRGDNVKLHSMNGDLLIVFWIQSNLHVLRWILSDYLLDLGQFPSSLKQAKQLIILGKC